MVFFTCGHCGESVKKPAVEKHRFKCRRDVFVTCMDCLKDFGDDYVQHTSCISEKERYSGKDYVPKASENSGLKKQQTWMETVKSILSSKDLKISPKARGIFQRLEAYDNVPRKKVKFENFVKNCMRISASEAQEVWNVLEKALELFKAEREAALAATKPKSEAEEEKKTEKDSNSNEEVVSKAESKKRKANESSGDASADETPSKKKRKNDVSEETIVTNGHNGNPTDEEVSAKKKKKKPKNEENGNDNAVEADTKSAINGHNEGVKDNVAGDEAPSFDWTDVIVALVAKKSKGMTIEKLQEKVAKKYKAFHQVEELPKKFQKTLKKKLNRSSVLLVEGDLVKIKG